MLGSLPRLIDLSLRDYNGQLPLNRAVGGSGEKGGRRTARLKATKGEELAAECVMSSQAGLEEGLIRVCRKWRQTGAARNWCGIKLFKSAAA
jgi:hypothetical protein